MSLTADMAINGEPIGRVVVRRTKRGGGPGGIPLNDEIHSYEVTATGPQGTIRAHVDEHRYGDGAHALMAKAMKAVAES